MQSRLAFAALAAIVALAAALRLWQARESLWLDELHTAWCALGTPGQVTPRAMAGNQSPLFFWLEWLLVRALGASELVLRLPSLVAGIGLPAVVAWFIHRWTRAMWLAALAAWLVAVDPKQIFFATEARPYALVELMAVLHFAMLGELSRSRSVSGTYWLRAALVLGGGLLFHLHYTTALLFPAELVAVAILKLVRDKPIAYRWRDIVLDGALIAALCLPALAHLQEIFGRRGNWEAFVPRPRWQDLWLILALLPWSWAALVVFARPRSKAAILALSWLLVPLLLAWLLTTTGTARLFFLRYLVTSAPAAIVLVILAIRMVPEGRVQTVVGLGIAALALATPLLPQLVRDGRPIADRTENWRAAIAHFNRQPAHRDYPVLVRTQLIEADALRHDPDPQLVDYCLFPVHSLYPVGTDPVNLIPLPRTNAGQLDPAVADVVRSRGGAWLIASARADRLDQIERELILSLRQVDQGAEVSEQRAESREQGADVGLQHGWHIVSRQSFGTVHVLLINPTLNFEP
jgi:mannosyltransferase